MKIAFVGLGQMGKPMALNLLKGGVELVVSSASDRSFAELRAAGAQATMDPAEIAGSRVIFLCLPGEEAVRGLVLGDKGLASRLVPGQILVDTSTTAYGTTLEVAQAVERSGAAFVDAPVSGMEARAREGTLTVMCGGPEEALETARPFMSCFGNKILHFGPVGSGQLAKLVNQLLFDINCAALAEILPMAMKMGLDPLKVAEIVNSGTGKSYASEFFIPRILRNEFSAGYPMKDAYKDLVSAAEIGARNGIPLPVLGAATATYQLALLRGHGGDDKGGMIKVYEEALGVAFREKARA